jgi:DNA-binding PadR family transcriptional regulator
MPEETTLSGIAENVGINYSHAPRAVKHLQSEGLIFEITAHTTAHLSGRRRKSYYPTEKGILVAKKLLDNLSKQKIDFMDEKGRIQKIMLGKLNELIEPAVGLFEIYRFIESNNLFDLSEWKKKKRLERFKGPSRAKLLQNKNVQKEINGEQDILLNFDQYPLTEEFLDREKELKELDQIIFSKESKFNLIVLTGSRGIGKSTLLATAISNKYLEKPKNYQNKKDHSKLNVIQENSPEIYWFDVSKKNSGFELFEGLINSLGYKNIFKTSNYNGKKFEQSNNYFGLIPNLIHFFNKQDTIFILDGLDIKFSGSELHIEEDIKLKEQFNKIIPDEDYLFNKFIFNLITSIYKESKTNNMNLKLVITTRKKIYPELLSTFGFDTIKDELLAGFEVKGLDNENIRIMLGENFSIDHAEAIYHHCSGNPLLIKTIKKIEKSKIEEFKKLSADDGALGIFLLAQDILEKELEQRNSKK